MTDNKYELETDEIKSILDKHYKTPPKRWRDTWMGALVSEIANAATAKVKGLMEAEMDRLREEILEQQKYIHGGE